MRHPASGLRARRSSFRFLAALVCVASLSACNVVREERAEINKETKFSQKEFQVAASPRVTESKKVKKGGGRYMVGKPYKVRGKWYKPKEDPSYAATGNASWYGPNFHGRLTANGEIFDQYSITAAHPTMPLPSYARVTNLSNGRSMIVRVNDRGPFAHNRVIDLSARAAKMLGYADDGVAKVKVEYVGKARLDGHDEKFLMASYRGSGFPEIVPGATQAGTMLAMRGTTFGPPAPDPTATPSSLFGSDGGTQIAQSGSQGQGFGNGVEQRIELALAGDIPVPTERPVTYGGLPISIADDQPFMTATLKPLGYRAEQGDAQRAANAFEAFDRKAETPHKTDKRAGAQEIAVIRLGRFSDGASAEFVRQTNGDLGMISLRRVLDGDATAWEVRLLAGGDVAEQLLTVLRERGLKDAELIGG